MDARTSEILEIRSTYPSMLATHPIIQARAVLPTPAIREVTSLVISKARRNRFSLAFWAPPMCGKSSCVSYLRRILPAHFTDCAIVRYEPSSKVTVAEGTLIEDLLSSINYAPRIQRSLAAKRDQLLRALYAMSIKGRHLFLLIDEAQNLLGKELGWLKRVVNWLIDADIHVTVVLFGQSQLQSLHQRILPKNPDLVIRFMSELIEFRNITSVDDLRVTLDCCDLDSEYPPGSGWSYTKYLWPEAYAHGFRLADCADAMLLAFREASPDYTGREGLGMQWVAEVLALVAEDALLSDGPKFRIRRKLWNDLVEASRYKYRPLPTFADKTGSQRS